MSSLLRLLPLLAVFIAPPAAAQPRAGGADSLLLTANQLAGRLTRVNVVLLHVGEPADYRAGHIPGARFLPYDAISERRDGLMFEMPPVAVLDSVFESLGVSDDSRVVLYWSKDWYSPTTRVFLTLDYLGLGREDVHPGRRFRGMEGRRGAGDDGCAVSDTGRRRRDA